MSDKSNSANGVSSYDSTGTGSLIHFFNRNVTPYATESSGPKFDLVPVEKHKDIMLNVARLHAKQEYDRIMELVSVLQKQAEQVAYDVLAYDAYKDVVPRTALFFHNLNVDPLWPYKQVAKIGNHIFYSKTKKSTQKTIAKTENNI